MTGPSKPPRRSRPSIRARKGGDSSDRAPAESGEPSDAHGADGPPNDGGEIGYRRPPPDHRWPKGRSGNPAGRKKGSKNQKTIIVRLMEQKLGRKIEDLSKLTRHEAMILRGIQKALTGDTGAMAFILRRYDDAAAAQGATEQVASEQDEAVLAALVDKIKRELKEAG